MNKKLIALAVAGASQPAAAQSFTPDAVDMAAAKREAKVVWYTSTPVEAAQKIATLFESQAGIHVELFRSGGSAILRRFGALADRVSFYYLGSARIDWTPIVGQLQQG